MTKLITHHPGPRARPRLLAAGLVAIVAIAAACGGDDSGSSTGADGDAAPSVAIESPSDGAQVGRAFDVELAVNFPIGDPSTGRDHVHIYYDGDTAEGEYGIAYDDTFTVEGLSPGTHMLEAVVAHADHSLTDTRSAPITVTVGEGGSTPAPATTSDGGGGY